MNPDTDTGDQVCRDNELGQQLVILQVKTYVFTCRLETEFVPKLTSWTPALIKELKL